jgi:hypothetical protein
MIKRVVFIFLFISNNLLFAMHDAKFFQQVVERCARGEGIDWANEEYTPFLAEIINTETATLENFKMLIRCGAPVDSSFQNQSVLMRALCNKRTDLAMVLFDYYENGIQEKKSEKSLLHAVAECVGRADSQEIMIRLLEEKIPVDTVDHKGKTALQYLADKNFVMPLSGEVIDEEAEKWILPMLQLLVHYGANPNYPLPSKKILEKQIKLPYQLTVHKCVFDYLKTRAPYTHLLLTSIALQDVQGIKDALEHNAEVDFQGAGGNTPLHMALVKYHDATSINAQLKAAAIFNHILRVSSSLLVRNYKKYTVAEEAIRGCDNRLGRFMIWTKPHEFLLDNTIQYALECNNMAFILFIKMIIEKI